MSLQTCIPIKFLLASLTLLLITSCECRRNAKGIIMDEATQLPIDSVRVEALTITLYDVYSDSSGNYSIGTSMTGSVGGCPDYNVSFSKEGYQTQVLVNPNGNVYLKME